MMKRKIPYDKFTFILSVIGFIGSIGFYAGVLHEVYSPANDSVKMEELLLKNAQLLDEIKELNIERRNDKK